MFKYLYDWSNADKDILQEMNIHYKNPDGESLLWIGGDNDIQTLIDWEISTDLILEIKAEVETNKTQFFVLV